MTERETKATLLVVDDTPENIDVLSGMLSKNYKIKVALNGKKALELAMTTVPDLILLDIMMPEMDGYETCRKLKETDKTKDIPVIFITAKSEEEDIVRGFQAGGADYITKPIKFEEVAIRVANHLERNQLKKDLERQYHETKVLLEKTLSGSVRILTEILSQADPKLYQEASSLRSMVKEVVKKYPVKNAWELELASMLYPIGYVSIPSDILTRFRQGKSLMAVEENLILSVPEISSQLVSGIPHLKNVSEIILYMNKHYDGTGFPFDPIKENNIPLGARILTLLRDVVSEEEQGKSRMQALDRLQTKQGYYDPQIKKMLVPLLKPDYFKTLDGNKIIPISLTDLRPGHTLAKNVESSKGEFLMSKDTKISFVKLKLLRNQEKINGLKEPIFIYNLMPDAEYIPGKG
ncbi:MAG: hypothetical protein COV66_02360 [Nitrospinae bacterium CG11_big_fil_rev_8_21_14_0_20_45_15]|nr:MAG: hypothetical protein COV66_02360 [Nitrospinae bacterium CG11_big_fil_rev_8_21_14_0_20_45_15]